MYLCIYVSKYLCIYVSMYLCIYVSKYLCIYASVYLCIYVSIYLCIYVSIYLCIGVSMYLYICVSVYLCICVKTLNSGLKLNPEPFSTSHGFKRFGNQNNIICSTIFRCSTLFIIHYTCHFLKFYLYKFWLNFFILYLI